MYEREELQRRAANLNRLAPQEWADFIRALAGYVEVHRNNMVNSPLPDLPINQGRAQFGTQMVLLLDTALKEDEKRKAQINDQVHKAGGSA